MAYNQQATPISEEAEYYLVAALAVDGNRNPDIHAGHCSIVVSDDFDSGGFVWWEVDLGDHYVITQVNIFHATNKPGR